MTPFLLRIMWLMFCVLPAAARCPTTEATNFDISEETVPMRTISSSGLSRVSRPFWTRQGTCEAQEPVQGDPDSRRQFCVSPIQLHQISASVHFEQAACTSGPRVSSSDLHPNFDFSEEKESQRTISSSGLSCVSCPSGTRHGSCGAQVPVQGDPANRRQFCVSPILQHQTSASVHFEQTACISNQRISSSVLPPTISQMLRGQGWWYEKVCMHTQTDSVLCPPILSHFTEVEHMHTCQEVHQQSETSSWWKGSPKDPLAPCSGIWATPDDQNAHAVQASCPFPAEWSPAIQAQAGKALEMKDDEPPVPGKSDLQAHASAQCPTPGMWATPGHFNAHSDHRSQLNLHQAIVTQVPSDVHAHLRTYRPAGSTEVLESRTGKWRGFDHQGIPVIHGVQEKQPPKSNSNFGLDHSEAPRPLGRYCPPTLPEDRSIEYALAGPECSPGDKAEESADTHIHALVSNTSDRPCNSQGPVLTQESSNSQRTGRKHPEEKKSGLTKKQPASRTQGPDKQPAGGPPVPCLIQISPELGIPNRGLHTHTSPSGMWATPDHHNAPRRSCACQPAGYSHAQPSQLSANTISQQGLGWGMSQCQGPGMWATPGNHAHQTSHPEHNPQEATKAHASSALTAPLGTRRPTSSVIVLDTTKMSREQGVRRTSFRGEMPVPARSMLRSRTS